MVVMHIMWRTRRGQRDGRRERTKGVSQERSSLQGKMLIAEPALSRLRTRPSVSRARRGELGRRASNSNSGVFALGRRFESAPNPERARARKTQSGESSKRETRAIAGRMGQSKGKGLLVSLTWGKKKEQENIGKEIRGLVFGFFFCFSTPFRPKCPRSLCIHSDSHEHLYRVMLRDTGREVERERLTLRKWSSKHCATMPLMRMTCSCANRVKLVMTGFELNVSPDNWCAKNLRNVFGSTPTSGGGRNSPSRNGGGGAGGCCAV